MCSKLGFLLCENLQTCRGNSAIPGQVFTLALLFLNAHKQKQKHKIIIVNAFPLARGILFPVKQKRVKSGRRFREIPYFGLLREAENLASFKSEASMTLTQIISTT